MVLNILAVVLKGLIDRFPRLVLVVLVIITALDIKQLWFLSAQGMIFFCLGYYFTQSSLSISVVDKLPAVPLAGLYLLSVIADSLLRGTAIQHFVRAASIILGCLFFTRITTYICCTKWKRRLLLLSNYTVSIFLFHEMFLTFLKKLAAVVLPTTISFQIVEYFGISAISIVWCIALDSILKRWFPRLHRVLTGGRGLQLSSSK